MSLNIKSFLVHTGMRSYRNVTYNCLAFKVKRHFVFLAKCGKSKFSPLYGKIKTLKHWYVTDIEIEIMCFHFIYVSYFNSLYLHKSYNIHISHSCTHTCFIVCLHLNEIVPVNIYAMPNHLSYQHDNVCVFKIVFKI